MSTIDIPNTSILERFGQARRLLNRTATQALKPLRIGVKQAILIRALGRLHRTCLAELSRITFTDPAATGKAVDCLIERGLVEQREHQTDRRRWEIMLTTSGRKLARQIEEVMASVADQMVGSLNPKEKKQFLETLNCIVTAFGSSSEEVTP